ncbi:hypothetical protein [Streptomyces sp. NPDC005732]|uniref:hypothetical protein n=1 Tax=Streptomyces sp. NPDC005732 TaxID=3157057 RepID=UPI0033F474B3
MAEPIPMQPRRDDAAADVVTLEAMDRIEEQPVPSDAPPPGSDLQSEDEGSGT